MLIVSMVSISAMCSYFLIQLGVFHRVSLFGYYQRFCLGITAMLPSAWNNKLAYLLGHAGYDNSQSIRITGTAFFASIGILALGLMSHGFEGQWGVWGLGGVTLWCCWLPILNAGRRSKLRQRQAVCALPATMELLAMLLGAGYPLVAALKKSFSHYRDHPLQDELKRVVNLVRTGTSFADAMNAFNDRLPTPEIRVFSNLLLQSSQQGSGLSTLLEKQAQVRREVMAAEIEQRAQESPVRLLFPLALFIFPATLVPFIGVIAAKIMWQV
ncbi:MAG: type II secretion system F family protein [Idiomarina sp.]|nr:type II secretion system F family protein [Idiomarina sp.]